MESGEGNAMNKTNLPQPKYEPTPAQIRASCAEIQGGWSADDERRHRCKSNPPVEIRETRIEVET